MLWITPKGHKLHHKFLKTNCNLCFAVDKLDAWYRFLSPLRKYKTQLMDTGLDSLKTASKKSSP